MDILQAIDDPALFGQHFRGPTWRAWRTFLAVLFGLPLRGSDLRCYRERTGRKVAPSGPFTEAWLPTGRRGGKSNVMALVAVYAAVFRDYSHILAPGERATVLLLAADRRQARVVFRYVSGLIDGSPMLAAMVEARTKEEIHLTNRVSIEVHTASFRSVRGYTIVAAILDEVAFWRSDDSANPDAEIVAALRPAMATVPGSLLLGISSPYARRGVLWDAYRRHFGRDDSDVLVWQAPTRAMNPTVPQSLIDRAMEEDEPRARAEYGAEFRRDVETFVSREVVDAATVPERRELPAVDGERYFAFVDPSGGSRDSMTLAIAHAEERDGTRRAVLDVLRESRPPFSPEQVVADFAADLSRYGLREVTGDRYAGEWPRERFRRLGIEYKTADKPKSDLYRDLLPAVNSQAVDLLDLPKLAAQLQALERRTARGGRDSIDHPPGGHDDLANAVAGVVHLVLARKRTMTWSDIYGDGGMLYDENGNVREGAW